MVFEGLTALTTHTCHTLSPGQNMFIAGEDSGQLWLVAWALRPLGSPVWDVPDFATIFYHRLPTGSLLGSSPKTQNHGEKRAPRLWVTFDVQWNS